MGMTQWILALMFAAAMSFLTFAASMAEAPGSEIVTLADGRIE